MRLFITRFALGPGFFHMAFILARRVLVHVLPVSSELDHEEPDWKQRRHERFKRSDGEEETKTKKTKKRLDEIPHAYVRRENKWSIPQDCSRGTMTGESVPKSLQIRSRDCEG